MLSSSINRTHDYDWLISMLMTHNYDYDFSSTVMENGDCYGDKTFAEFKILTNSSEVEAWHQIFTK